MTEPLVVDLLKRARDVFREHGGAVEILENSEGRVCARGALHLASRGVSRPCINSSPEELHANVLLDLAARSVFGKNCLEYVNDVISPNAAMDCYDHAIKLLESADE